MKNVNAFGSGVNGPEKIVMAIGGGVGASEKIVMAIGKDAKGIVEKAGRVVGFV